MTLTNLISELKTAIEERGLAMEEAEQLIEGRINIPEGFEAGYDSVGLKNMNLGGSRGDAPLYHLLVSLLSKITLDEIQPVLDRVFSRAKGLKLDRGTAEVNYGVLWTPELFRAERKLTGLFFDEVRVEARAYTCDPTKARIGMPWHAHEIGATTKLNRMTIKATGKYRGELEGIVERYNPQIAKLNLSEDDAKRLLRTVRKKPIGKYVLRRLEKALQPIEQQVIQLSSRGGMSFGTQRVIEISVPTLILSRYEDIIGKPLLASNQSSRVTELVKVYGIGRLWRGERLSDLQALARDIAQMDLGIPYNHPVLTNDSARNLLDAEINIISESHKSSLGPGLPSDVYFEGLGKELAKEHFDADVVDRLDELNLDDYVKFLKAKGYVEPRAEDVESEKARKIYARERAEGRIKDRAFAYEPDDTAKQRHLFEFFRQSYANDPRDSIRRFREFYQNKEPQMIIFARGGGKDASKLGKLKIPSESRLFEFGITEQMEGKYRNDMFIKRTLPSSDEIYFLSRTSVDSPIFLPLQEYVCHEFGIRFN